MPESVYASAWFNIEEYRQENPGHITTKENTKPAHSFIFSTLWVCLILGVAFMAAGSGDAFRIFVFKFGASSEKILKGEVYRAVTALTLHSSPAHLLGNIAAISIFGASVCRITGSGAGWLMILLTGILGNMANACFHGSAHLSVGASTAVFGAVGFLSAYQFHNKMKASDHRQKAWLPVAGGLALLGFLSAGPHTDLMGHLFGFIAGILMGLGYSRCIKGVLSRSIQAVCFGIGFSLLSGGWLWAYF